MVDLPKLVVAGHKATSARTFALCIGARVLRNAEEEREEAVATMGLIPNEVVFREAHTQHNEELDDNEETQVTNPLFQMLSQQLLALVRSRKPLVNFGFKHVPDSRRQMKMHLTLPPHQKACKMFGTTPTTTLWVQMAGLSLFWK